MLKMTFVAALFLLISGCATDSGVIQMGDDTYIITKQAATGLSGIGNLKADAMKDAYAHCSQSGRSVKVTDAKESKPPYLLGNYPRVEISFQCVNQ